MRARVGAYASYYVLKQKEFLICVVYEKKYSCRCQTLRSKIVGMQYHEKHFSI